MSKTPFSEHEEKLDKVAMFTEYFSNIAPTSATRSFYGHLKSDDAKRASSQKNNYFNERNKQKVSFNISACFTTVLDEMTLKVYSFDLDIRSSLWVSLHSRLLWEPNDVLEKDRLIMDWRGH